MSFRRDPKSKTARPAIKDIRQQRRQAAAEAKRKKEIVPPAEAAAMVVESPPVAPPPAGVVVSPAGEGKFGKFAVVISLPRNPQAQQYVSGVLPFNEVTVIDPKLPPIPVPSLQGLLCDCVTPPTAGWISQAFPEQVVVRDKKTGEIIDVKKIEHGYRMLRLDRHKKTCLVCDVAPGREYEGPTVIWRIDKSGQVVDCESVDLITIAPILMDLANNKRDQMKPGPAPDIPIVVPMEGVKQAG